MGYVSGNIIMQGLEDVLVGGWFTLAILFYVIVFWVFHGLFSSGKKDKFTGKNKCGDHPEDGNSKIMIPEPFDPSW